MIKLYSKGQPVTVWQMVLREHVLEANSFIIIPQVFAYYGSNKISSHEQFSLSLSLSLSLPPSLSLSLSLSLMHAHNKPTPKIFPHLLLMSLCTSIYSIIHYMHNTIETVIIIKTLMCVSVHICSLK